MINECNIIPFLAIRSKVEQKLFLDGEMLESQEEEINMEEGALRRIKRNFN